VTVFYTPASWADEVPILIDLADRKSDVATSTDNGFQIRMPDYLWDRYQAYRNLDAFTDIATNAEADDTPAPKKRGRPRKNPATSPDEES